MHAADAVDLRKCKKFNLLRTISRNFHFRENSFALQSTCTRRTVPGNYPSVRCQAESARSSFHDPIGDVAAAYLATEWSSSLVELTRLNYQHAANLYPYKPLPGRFQPLVSVLCQRYQVVWFFCCVCHDKTQKVREKKSSLRRSVEAQVKRLQHSRHQSVLRC